MGSRLELNAELLKFVPNVYFQPPSNVKLKYPCLVYNKNDRLISHANNTIYKSKQGYQLMYICQHPDDETANIIESELSYCSINQYYVVDGLHHTTLNLYY